MWGTRGVSRLGKSGYNMNRPEKQYVAVRTGLSSAMAVALVMAGVGVAGASTYPARDHHTDVTHLHHDHGRHHGSVRGLITAISPTAITVRGRHDAAVTFTIDAATTVTKDHATATVADLVVGERVTVVSSAIAAATAGSINISSPRGDHKGDAKGVVSAVSPTSITIQGRHGPAVTYAIDATTRVFAGRSAGLLSDLVAGERVRVKSSSASAMTAASITIDVAHTAGRVAAVTGNTIVLLGGDGHARIIDVTGATTFTKNGVTATLADVSVGSQVFAEGFVAPSHSTLDATTVGIGSPQG